MNAQQDESMPDRRFNDILSPLAFRLPERLQISSWIEHIPFAHWLIERTTPRLVVELGTFSGTSYLAFCEAVKALQCSTSCFAVDTWRGDLHGGYYGEDVYRTFVEYHDCRYASFSRLIRSTFDDAVGQFEDGSIDLLHIDGLHTYEAVRHDFETWRPKLSSRATALFHDTAARHSDFGVYRFWDELSAAHAESFQFMHCYGLGVLGVGTDLPAALRRFFSLARTTDGTRLIRDVYSRLGSACSAMVFHQGIRDALEFSDSMAVQRQHRG